MMATVLSLRCSQKPYSTVSNPSLIPFSRFNKFPKRFRIQSRRCSNCSASFSAIGEYQQFLPPISSKIGQGLSCSTSGSEPEPEETEQPEADGEADDVGVKAALSMLKFYKREISPLLPKSCRYVPTCSEYSMIAYKKYGVVKGTILTAWRLCRCNPLGGSGFDPPRWFGKERVPEE